MIRVTTALIGSVATNLSTPPCLVPVFRSCGFPRNERIRPLKSACAYRGCSPRRIRPLADSTALDALRMEADPRLLRLWKRREKRTQLLVESGGSVLSIRY